MSLRALWRATGLMVLVTAVSTVIAAVLHVRSSLPGSYTWFEPTRTLFDVAGQPWLFSAAVGAYLLGKLRLHPRLPKQVDRHRVARAAVLALALAVADALLFPLHTPLDRFALCVVAWEVAVPREPAQLRRAVIELAIVTVVFLAICYSFTIWKALVFVGRPSVDPQILSIEHAIFGVLPHRVIAAWSAERPWVIHLCDWVYFQFFAHMFLTGALLVGMRRTRMRLEFMSALGLCYLIGAPLYHLAPAAGPAYVDAPAFAHLEHMGLMANGVRAWLFHNTADVLHGTAHNVQTWGYIASMPSLHIAQEVTMLWYARSSRPAFALALVFTSITCLAVVVLGWHYPLDVVAGMALGAVAIAIAHAARAHTFPAIAMPPEDAPLP